MFKFKLMSTKAELDKLIDDVMAEKRFELFVEYCVGLYRNSGTHSVPKSLFRPNEITTALPYISINEMISDDNIQIRIIGTELELIFGGQEMRGVNALNSIPPQNVEATSQFYMMVAQHNLVSFLDEDLKLANGKQYRCITVGLPMCDETGNNRFRIAITKLDFDPKEYLESSEFQIARTKLHDLRFADMDTFSNALREQFPS